MCRLLAYLGPTITLDQVLLEPEHSLVVQGYQPKEMEVALLNADGFGMTWYSPTRNTDPFVYRSIVPIWNDINLSDLCRSAATRCALAYVRSATPGLAVDLHNCQPFRSGKLTFIHNGFIEHFRQTLYRPIREQLCDAAYHSIHGLTDSEHLFAWILHELETQSDPTPEMALEMALANVLCRLNALAHQHQIRAAANIILSDGEKLVISRFDSTGAAPSLYWLRHHPRFPEAVLFASEPLFEAGWMACPQATLITVTSSGDFQTLSLPISHPDGAGTLPAAV